jgi:hypothetical protein
MSMSQKIENVRAELLHLRARYDDGAVQPGVYEAIKELETTIAWLEHRQNSGRVRITENGRA